MADFTIKGDTSLDGAGLQKGLSSMTVAAGNLISGMVEGLANQAQTTVSEIYQVGTAYESSLAKVKSIDPSSDMEAVSASVLEVSNRTGQAAALINEAVYSVISATGQSASEALSTVETANQLAVGGFTDLNSAISAINTATNAYKDSNLEAADVANSLIATQNLGVTTVGELAGSMGKAIATGSAYGVSLGNIESGYVSLTKSGIGTAESTTYLSSMFNELGDSGTKVGKILQSRTGKSFGQLMADGNSLADILQVLSDSVDGDAEALMNLWGSSEAGKASNAILNQGLEQFNENLATIEGSTTAAGDAYATMTDTMEFKSQQLVTNAQNLGILLYQSMADGLLPIADLGLDAIQQLTEGMSNGGISGMMSAAGDLIQGFAQGVIENAPGMISSGVQAVADFINGLAGPDTMSGMMNTAGQLILTLAMALATNTPKLWEAAINLIHSLCSYLIENLPQIITAGTQIITALVASLLGAAARLASAAVQLIAQFSAKWKDMGGWIGIGQSIIQGIIQGIKAAASSLIEAAVDAAKGAMDAVKKFLGIHSPARKPRKEIGEQSGIGVALGWEDSADRMAQSAADSVDTMYRAAKAAVAQNRLAVTTAIVGTGQASQLAAQAAIVPTVTGGDTTNLNMTVNTHDSLSESELCREAEDMLNRSKWKLH